MSAPPQGSRISREEVEKVLEKLSENTAVSKQLDEDISTLTSALNKHRQSSKWYSRALIALTIALIILAVVQILGL